MKISTAKLKCMTTSKMQISREVLNDDKIIQPEMKYILHKISGYKDI